MQALLKYSWGFILQRQGESTDDLEKRKSLFLSAQAYYQFSLSEDPDNDAVHYNMALLLEESGRIPEAIEELNSALDDNPARAWEYGVKLGDLYLRLQQNKFALELSAGRSNRSRRTGTSLANCRSFSSRTRSSPRKS
jgi:tetratricopeptide (TPR) repeat protein